MFLHGADIPSRSDLAALGRNAIVCSHANMYESISHKSRKNLLYSRDRRTAFPQQSLRPLRCQSTYRSTECVDASLRPPVYFPSLSTVIRLTWHVCISQLRGVEP